MDNLKRVVVVIPARFASSRYPGKPLVHLLGKPMILWVAELASRAVSIENVYVATDDERIKKTVESAGFNAVLTGPALTGTDRVAEAAESIEADVYINLQGDEPLVDPEDIKKVIIAKSGSPDKVINGFSFLDASEDPYNVNIPKLITNEANHLVYMSRAALPGHKDEACAPEQYKKQVCIYAFNREELKAYRDFGRKSALEQCEDIEILRFLELGKHILMIKTQPGSYAVDTPEDVETVEHVMRSKGMMTNNVV